MSALTGRSPYAERVIREAGCVHPRLAGEPVGYVAWHEWVERKARTHECQQCPKCQLWVIWTRKIKPLG